MDGVNEKQKGEKWFQNFKISYSLGNMAQLKSLLKRTLEHKFLTVSN
jgi:hypothetical protein